MKLVAYLSQKNMSVAAFGRMVGVPNRSTMSKYAKGERFPPAKVLRRINLETAGAVTANDFVEQAEPSEQAAA